MRLPFSLTIDRQMCFLPKVRHWERYLRYGRKKPPHKNSTLCPDGFSNSICFLFLNDGFFQSEDFACLKTLHWPSSLTWLQFHGERWQWWMIIMICHVKIQRTTPATISEMLMYNEEKYHFHLLVVYVYTSALFPAGWCHERNWYSLEEYLYMMSSLVC